MADLLLSLALLIGVPAAIAVVIGGAVYLILRRTHYPGMGRIERWREFPGAGRGVGGGGGG